MKGRCKGMSLWKFSHADMQHNSPRLYKLYQNSPFLLREASPYTCQKASYTLEAAVVIPLMLFFFTWILFFFPILQVQYEIEKALIYAGRKTAVESSMVTSPELLMTSAKGYFLYALRESDGVKNYVRGGSLGILLWDSEFTEEEILLKANYDIVLPMDFWNIGTIRLYTQNYFRKWSGDVTTSAEETWVYITPKGTVYHRTPSCRVLDIRIREVEAAQIETERGMNGQKYYPCSRCHPETTANSIFYCTNYGTLYHRDISCSALKRTIQKISLEEIGERLPCSFCNEG